MNIGTIIQWGSNTIPNGWLLCDGSAVSRTTYADLFAVIGTNFGTGDGSTTFNLPDLRGKIGVGKSTDTDFDTLGETGGNKTHKHLTQMAMTGTENEKYLYGFLNNEGQPYYGSEVLPNVKRATIAPVNTGDNEPVRIAYTDDGSSLQPYIVVNYIIKALKPSDIKVSELNSATSVNDSDLLMIVQSGENKKATAQNVVRSVNGNVIFKSSSGITGATITSADGYGTVLIISAMFVCLLQVGNTEVYIKDIYGTHGTMQASINNKVVTLTDLYNWDHYIFIGSSSITNISF